MGKGKIVYEGIHEAINGKASFMRQSMQHGKGYGAEGDDGASCMLAEEEAGYLYDGAFCGKAMYQAGETNIPVYPAYAPGNAIDITGFLVYGIIWNKWCRQMLWAEIPGGDEYYEYYEKSKYCGWALEECLKAEEIWDARLLIGLIEKMRQTEENGPMYNLLMKIIYAGYEGVGRWMAGKVIVSGSDMKTQMFISQSEEYSMLHCISEIVVAMVVAQDKGVEVCFEHEMLQLLRFMERGEKEMRGYNGCGIYCRKTVKKGVEGHGFFLKRFREKYGTDSSLEVLASKNGTERMDNLLLGVMELYHINPQMFCGINLTEKEVQALLGLNDRWTAESYWSMLVIAHLCKYVKALKEGHLKVHSPCGEMNL